MKFKDYLRWINTKESNKTMLCNIHQNLGKENICRKIFITGEHGSGKTRLVKQLISNIKFPIIYYGLEKHSGHICCKTTSEILDNCKKHKECVIFIDNFSTTMINKSDGWGGYARDDLINLFKIFDAVDNSKNITLILVDQKEIPKGSLRDRLDIKFELNLPTTESKILFIKSLYEKQMDLKSIKYLAVKTIGYTFRDIDSIIKSLILSEEKISVKLIKRVLGRYTPSALLSYETTHISDLNFNKLVGKEKIKQQLRNVILSRNNQELALNLGVKTNNLLFFYGNPGTGKTYMAKALGGETGLPIVTINTATITSKENSPAELLQKVIGFSRRFGDCIFLFDEAEKIFGKKTLDEDGALQGDLQSYLDGVGEKMKSIIIFTLNEEARFGAALKDRFLMFKFDEPTLEEKTEFLKRKYELAKTHFTIDIDIKSLANDIGNKSFREVEKVWDQTILNKLTQNEKHIEFDDFKQTINELKIKKDNPFCG